MTGFGKSDRPVSADTSSCFGSPTRARTMPSFSTRRNDRFGRRPDGHDKFGDRLVRVRYRSCRFTATQPQHYGSGSCSESGRGLARAFPALVANPITGGKPRQEPIFAKRPAFTDFGGVQSYRAAPTLTTCYATPSASGIPSSHPAAREDPESFPAAWRSRSGWSGERRC